MKVRPLGSTGVLVSEIGFGGWGIGGGSDGLASYGATDDQESARALQRACELGVNFYDTSDLYGNGHSERLIGETLKEVRQKVVIASKVGFLRGGLNQNFSPQHIRTSLERSLERLQTDYLDLYQLHNPKLDALEPLDDSVQTLQALKKAGKVRTFGLSVRSPQDGLAALNRWDFDTLQVNLNMIDQRALEIGLLSRCQTDGVGVIARTPLCFGFLTGKYTAESRFGVNDHRSAWPRAQIALWAGAHALFTQVLGRETKTETALRFCLTCPGVSTVIPGMLKQQQVDENVAAGNLGPLPKADLQIIQRVYQQNRFFLAKEPVLRSKPCPA